MESDWCCSLSLSHGSVLHIGLNSLHLSFQMVLPYAMLHVCFAKIVIDLLFFSMSSNGSSSITSGRLFLP